jgi:hypothetical protein
MDEATTAANLRAAGQNLEQYGITFGQQQEDRSKGLKAAKAWAQGVAAGLTTGKT